MEKNHHSARKSWRLCVFIVGMSLVWSLSTAAQSNPRRVKMENTKRVESLTDEKIASMPPIDADAPALVETASFGLG